MMTAPGIILLTLPFTVWGGTKEPKTPDNTTKAQVAAMLKPATFR